MKPKILTVNVSVVLTNKDECYYNNADSCYLSTWTERFKIEVNENMSISDIRSFIVSAINAIEDENPDDSPINLS